MLDIQRTNKVLMEKLIDISKGKQSNVASSKSAHPIKSMNSNKRKKAMKNIDQENIKLMMRIIKQKSQISIKDMQGDYETKQKYMARISKASRATLEKTYDDNKRWEL